MQRKGSEANERSERASGEVCAKVNPKVKVKVRATRRFETRR